MLIARLPGDTRVLEIDGEREFGYRSVYFDSPDLSSYLAAARPRRRRYKVRVRSYLDSDLQFVEVKTRGSRGATVKDRLSHPGSAYELGAAGRTYVAETLTAAGLHDRGHRVDDLGPVLTVRYRRTTLLLPRSGARATLDTQLSWQLPGAAPLALPDLAIVETKSARAATEVDRALWTMRHRPSTVSKYGTGLAALRPELPSHKWAPVLRAHFPAHRFTTSLTPRTPYSRIPYSRIRRDDHEPSRHRLAAAATTVVSARPLSPAAPRPAAPPPRPARPAPARQPRPPRGPLRPRCSPPT